MYPAPQVFSCSTWLCHLLSSSNRSGFHKNTIAHPFMPTSGSHTWCPSSRSARRARSFSAPLLSFGLNRSIAPGRVHSFSSLAARREGDHDPCLAAPRLRALACRRLHSITATLTAHLHPSQLFARLPSPRLPPARSVTVARRKRFSIPCKRFRLSLPHIPLPATHRGSLPSWKTLRFPATTVSLLSLIIEEIQLPAPATTKRVICGLVLITILMEEHIRSIRPRAFGIYLLREVRCTADLRENITFASVTRIYSEAMFKRAFRMDRTTFKSCWV